MCYKHIYLMDEICEMELQHNGLFDAAE